MARATDLKDRTDPGLTASAVVIGQEATLNDVDRTARRANWAIAAPPAIDRSHYLGSIRPNLRTLRLDRTPPSPIRRHPWAVAPNGFSISEERCNGRRQSAPGSPALV